jgi:cytochrome c oxidase subunit 4
MKHHVLSLPAHLAVFGVLLILTAVTVAVATVDMGPWNTIVALVVASVKGLVVILWFMHVKFASKLTRVFVSAGFVWLVIMILLTAGDYANRAF